MYKWFLSWRYLHTKLIAIFGVASVTLCVAMVLVVMSVMGGFLETIRSRSRGLHSEILLEGASLQGFPYYDEFGAYLKETMPDVVRVTTPAIYSYGIFRVPATKYTKPARILGVKFDEYVQVNEFKKGLYYEKYFPGSTSMGEQGMPVAGVNQETGVRRLPDDLEEANARWRATETDKELIDEYNKLPYEISPYPYVTPGRDHSRVYSADLGEPHYAGPKFPGIVVGTDLLNIRRPDGDFDRPLARGTQVALTVIPITQSGNPTGEPPVKLPLRYSDDSRTGIYEIDSLCAYLDFDVLQHALAMDAQERIDGTFTRPRTSQYLIDLQDGVDLNEGAEKITRAWLRFQASLGSDMSSEEAQLLSFVGVHTWEDLQRPFIAAVEKERVLMLIILSIICLVAIVLLALIFYMIVEKKTRDIGILKSLGASGQGVATLFVSYACVVGVVGSILGTIIGCEFVWYINDIQDFLASLNPALRVWSPDVYSFDKIPEIVNTQDAVTIAIAAILSSIMGSLIPAILAGRVWPVQALRYE